MQDNFVVELRNKENIWITADQARVVDQAWRARKPVKIGSSIINTVDMLGLWDLETWISNHPEHKPVTQEVKALPQAVEKSPNADLWIECLQKNKKLLLDGKMPKYIVENGKIIEKENYWHDREEPETPKAYWVKKEVPLKQWISHYSQSPGYHLLENNGDQVEMAFTTLDPKNYQKLDVHEIHPSW